MLTTFIKLIVIFFRFIQRDNLRGRIRATKGDAKDCATAPSHLQLIATHRGRVGRFSDNHSIGYF